MKKNIFKKIVASLATVAMAAGLFAAMPAEETKAADGKLYVTGDFCGWNWDKCATLTTADDDTYVGQMIVSGDSAIVIVEGGNTWEGTTKQKYMYDGSETDEKTISFDKAGKYEMKYVKSTKEISFTFKGEIEWTYEYYIAGPSELGADSWDKLTSDTVKKQMTKNGDVYTLETTATKAGDYEYCVIKVAKTDEAGVDPTVTWIKHPTELNSENKPANFSAKGLKAGKVKFEYNSADGSSKVTQVSVDDDNNNNNNNNNNKNNNNKNNNNKNNNNTPVVKNEVTVEVTLDPSLKWDEVYVHAWGDNFSTKWPGVKMTAKDGKYYATIDTKLTKLSYVISAGDKKPQTIDITDVNGQDVKITVTAKKDAKGEKFVATAKTAGTTGTAKPGDVAPVVVMLVVAMAAASVVVASKKKTICE